MFYYAVDCYAVGYYYGLHIDCMIDGNADMDVDGSRAPNRNYTYLRAIFLWFARKQCNFLFFIVF
jgi:hypothetical protein